MNWRGGVRSDISGVLLRADIEVIWDAQVTSFEEIGDKVHLHFANTTKHSTEVADLVIAAEGAHSPIRRQLNGVVAHAAGFNGIVGLIKKTADGSNDDLFEHELIHNAGVLCSGRGGKSASTLGDGSSTVSFS